MNRKILRFILVISLLLNFSVLLSAGYSYYKSGHKKPLAYESKDGYLLDLVSLRPEQRETIKAKALAFHTKIDAERAKVISKRIELVAMLRSDHPDPGVIKGKLAEIGKLQGEIQRMAVIHMLEVKGMLDKDQQNQLFDLIQEAMKSQGPGRIW